MAGMTFSAVIRMVAKEFTCQHTKKETYGVLHIEECISMEKLLSSQNLPAAPEWVRKNVDMMMHLYRRFITFDSIIPPTYTQSPISY